MVYSAYQILFSVAIVILNFRFSLAYSQNHYHVIKSNKHQKSLVRIKSLSLSLSNDSLISIGGDNSKLKFTNLYLKASIFSGSIVTAEFLSLFQPGYPSPFLGNILPAYMASTFSSIILLRGAERNRLGGNTFKFLNLGLFLSSMQTVLSTIPLIGAIMRSPDVIKSIFGILCLLHAYLTVSTSYNALLQFGLPSFKKIELLKNVLATLYLVRIIL